MDPLKRPFTKLQVVLTQIEDQDGRVGYSGTRSTNRRNFESKRGRFYPCYRKSNVRRFLIYTVGFTPWTEKDLRERIWKHSNKCCSSVKKRKEIGNVGGDLRKNVESQREGTTIFINYFSVMIITGRGLEMTSRWYKSLDLIRVTLLRSSVLIYS